VLYARIFKKPIQLFITLLFIFWISVLLYALYLPNSRVLIDALNQVDVSDLYPVEMLILRYIIDPFVAIAFLVEFDDTEWMLLFVLGYFAVRIFLYYIEKKGSSINISDHPLLYLVQDTLEVFMKVSIIVFSIVFGYLGIGFAFGGFLFPIDHFQFALSLGSVITVSIFIIKLISNIIKGKRFYTPDFLKDRKDKKWILRKELARPIGVFAFLLFLFVSNTVINFPNQRINANLEDDEILFDFHSHTILSDGTLTPEQRVLWYISQGIDGAVFSDHDQTQGARKAREFVEEHDLDFTVITGQEYTSFTPGIHLNIFGLDEVILPSNFYGFPYTWGDSNCMNVSDMITYVHDHGGWVIVNHYDDERYYALEDLRDWGVDGFELVNSAAVQSIRQFCLDNNLMLVGGSDVHSNEELNTFMKLKLDDPNDKSITAIFNAAKNNPSEILYFTYSHPLSFSIELIASIWNYLTSINMFQILSWIGWTTGFYLLTLVIIKKNKKLISNR
jgi:hypothetical protein